MRGRQESVQVPPPMTRIAAVAMLVVGVVMAGCSGSELCGPSTCDGCCTADGVCVAGDSQAECGDNGLWCQACSGAETCQAGLCRAPQTPDAGTPDAGHEEADAGVVFVTMHYQITQTPPGCPPNNPVTTKACDVALAISKASFDAVRSEYASCVITQPTSDGYDIACGGCESITDKCLWDPDGGQGTPTYYNYPSYDCPTPAHASVTTCQWDVP